MFLPKLKLYCYIRYCYKVTFKLYWSITNLKLLVTLTCACRFCIEIAPSLNVLRLNMLRHIYYTLDIQRW